jgi:uncharacterized membrane protein YphA (DoxX/SURF4 family)
LRPFCGRLLDRQPPVSGGLKFWILQEGNYAAFAMHKWIATNVLVPALPVLDPIVFPAELLRAASFMLGFFVRPMAVIGIFYTLQLWLGLYQNPSEWPWEYMFLIFTMGFFYVCRAGMSLGSTHGSPVSHLGHSGTTALSRPSTAGLLDNSAMGRGSLSGGALGGKARLDHERVRTLACGRRCRTSSDCAGSIRALLQSGPSCSN